MLCWAAFGLIGFFFIPVIRNKTGWSKTEAFLVGAGLSFVLSSTIAVAISLVIEISTGGDRQIYFLVGFLFFFLALVVGTARIAGASKKNPLGSPGQDAVQFEKVEAARHHFQSDQQPENKPAAPANQLEPAKGSDPSTAWVPVGLIVGIFGVVIGLAAMQIVQSGDLSKSLNESSPTRYIEDTQVTDLIPTTKATPSEEPIDYQPLLAEPSFGQIIGWRSVSDDPTSREWEDLAYEFSRNLAIPEPYLWEFYEYKAATHFTDFRDYYLALVNKEMKYRLIRDEGWVTQNGEQAYLIKFKKDERSVTLIFWPATPEHVPSALFFYQGW